MEPGLYWIKRNEPDGPAAWEPARYLFARMETWDYWNGRHLSEPVEYHYWQLLGHGQVQRQVETPGASNAWIIGPRIEAPED